MYRSLMVPLDGSSYSEYALPLALGIARAAGACVRLVYVHPPRSSASPDGSDHERTSRYLTELAICLSEGWEVAITATVLDGSVADTLSNHALAHDVDLVVMTTHGRGAILRVGLGSVADVLVRNLPKPILLVRPDHTPLDLLESVHVQAFQHVLIPLDGSALAEEILKPAMTLGRLMRAEYTLLQAIQAPLFGYAPEALTPGLNEQVLEQRQAEARAYLERVAERMRGQHRQVRTKVLCASPADAILAYAHEQAVDMIALATHGRGGITRMLLGSVADQVVRGAAAPVLVYHPRGDAQQQNIADTIGSMSQNPGG